MARIRVRGMPALVLALVVAAVTVVVCAEARVPDYYHPSTFTVTGKVQYQDCTKNWNAYAYNAKPIPGSSPFRPRSDLSSRSTQRAVDTRQPINPRPAN